MTANWLAGWRYKFPKGHGDVEPILAQGTEPKRRGFCPTNMGYSAEPSKQPKRNTEKRDAEGMR